MSGNNVHIFNDEYTGRKSNYIEDPKIAKEKKYGEEASTNEASNQMIKEPIYKKGYDDKNKTML